MKKTFILLPVVGMLFYVLFASSASGPGLTGDGDRTGATGTTGCFGSGCHSSSPASAITVKVELYDAGGTTLVTSYTGGTAYKIRVTGTNTGSTTQSKFGFQVTAVKTSSTSTSEGTLTAISGTHAGVYSGINVVEHSSAMPVTTGTGGSGSTYVVNIPWTAPVSGTGSVSLFAVLNAVNGSSTADPGDLWNNNSLVVPEATSSVTPITGTLTVCKAATTPLSDATSGGTWSSGNTSIATVTSLGVVTGVAAGTAIISYNLGTPGTATATVTVSTTPAPAAITGASTVCAGTHIILTDATTGGAWSSTATTAATVNSSGVVSGVAIGSATISYTITNACGSAAVTHTVTVKALGGTCVSAVLLTPVSGTELKVFPNPNTGSFSMNLVSENDETARVTITNLVGATVKEFTTMTNRENEISISGPTGVYFLTARTATAIYVSKVLTR